ncbi:4-hydroxy-tetrahydrodipicolinate reductase [Hyphomicrobium methylovorum]|uniref:4-hydroxy-tetrahydrodipicolinate reductase n=1 Tax=Hyphomicrobium methylovorum TaxID=84 RepID=UPI0015E747FB|nr:4-hydroxy-tetrahydrodipicolinate reductase [Hyphomicrobium methylovorum]MBA2126181.1 4-hydroxy-tetrahydrodipicolinate reductase [Hyphomicrobium methylovorum]
MKIAVMGAAGRMGRELILAIAAEPGCTVSGATESAGSPELGKDAGELAGTERLGVTVTSDAAAVIAAADAIVDFTVPKASVEFARLAAQSRTAHILGTTGFDAAGERAIADAAKQTAIVKAGNMSLGVNLLAALTKRVAAVLGNEYDIEIVEMHHRMKVDAPSGTALMLGDAAAAGRNIGLEDHSVRVRDGHTGARKPGDIGFATLRGGNVVGEHTVYFAGPGERIELTHRATDRGIFARGAVKAAVWTKDRPPGLYSMADVLGI